MSGLIRQVTIKDAKSSRRAKAAIASNKLARKSSQASRRSRIGRVVSTQMSYSDIKQVATSLSTITVGATAQFTCISNIAEGSSYNERDGRKVACVSLRVRGLFQASATGCTLRRIIFYDKASQGLTPSVTDLLRTGTSSGNPVNLDSSDRFVILKDDKFYYESGCNGLYSNEDVYLPLSGLPLMYAASTAATTSNNSSIWVMLLSNNGTILPIQYQCDLRYKDI